MPPPLIYSSFNLLLANPLLPISQNHSHSHISHLLPSRSSITSLLAKMQPHGLSPSTVNLREFMSPGKDKITNDLKRALDLLEIKGLDGLEEHVLKTDAFLRPWAEFRDGFFLLQPDSKPRASSPGRIQRLDVLWFYTNFDEGFKRYDSRADPRSIDYTSDTSRYGIIDKSDWSVEDHEKLLYVWLMQEFRVGKGRNPYGFGYFNYKNICVAWEEVFIPIVNTVRASYDVKGRRHYGRLAAFIEEQCPSRLAFPEGNVAALQVGPATAAPFRVVSIPKKSVAIGTREESSSGGSEPGILVKKHYDLVEQELRNVFPGFGGLVERPRFRVTMKDWLSQQKARAARTRALGQLELEEENRNTSNGYAPSKDNGDERERPRQSGGFRTPRHSVSHSISSERHSYSPSQSRLAEPNSSSPPSTPKTPKTPIVPYGMYGYVPKTKTPKPKSPFHGFTREIFVPKTPPRPRSPTQKVTPNPRRQRNLLESVGPEFFEQAEKPIPDLPIQNPGHARKGSDDSVYSSVRDSNPFTHDLPDVFNSLPKLKGHERAASNDSERSPMHPLSAIPRPLFNVSNREENRYLGSMNSGMSPAHVEGKNEPRHPSYEGTGYDQDIYPEMIHGPRIGGGRASNAVRGDKKLPQLPQSIQAVPYAGHLRAASNQSRKMLPTIPRSVPWPGNESPPNSAPKPMPWSGVDAPLVPLKNPARWNSLHGHVTRTPSEQLLRDDSIPSLGPRIVSKDNIRAALKNENSEEDLTLDTVHEDVPRNMSPIPSPLQTYNSHMFPRQDRKGTPVGGWIDKRRFEKGGEYEMEVLQGGTEE